MGDRRPSLIDQMAMAAALEGLVDRDHDEDDDEDDDVEKQGLIDHDRDDEEEDIEDDDDHSSLGNDVSLDFNLRMGRMSSESRLSGASSRMSGASTLTMSSTGASMLRAAEAAVSAARISYLGRLQSSDNTEPMIHEYGEDDDDGHYFGDSYSQDEMSQRTSQASTGRNGSSGEFILDGDIMDVSNEEYNTESHHVTLEKNRVPGFHRYEPTGGIISGTKPQHSLSNRSRDDSTHSDRGSALSRVDSESNDHFDAEQLLIEQRFGGTSGLSPVAVSNVTSRGSNAAASSSDDPTRLSFNQNRRTSYNSGSDHSIHSAPSPYSYRETEGIPSNAERRRSGPISVQVAEEGGLARESTTGPRLSIRRQSVQIPGVASAGSMGTASSPSGSITETHRHTSHTTTGNEEEGSGSGHGNGGSIISAVSRLTGRSRTRPSMSIAARQGVRGSLETAIDTLRNQDSNSEWENVGAAMTVVAASEAGASAIKRHIKFAVNDTVLVFLTLLNVTNMEDPKDTFTIAPVNKYGFPVGEGRSEAEKSGPYTFVVCTVRHVHFDEDDRYYTVERADTCSQQRADSGWMEPITDPDGIEAAMEAARKTVRSTQDKPEEVLEDNGAFHNCMDMLMDLLSWPSDFFLTTVLPFYRRLRQAAKVLAAQLLFGEAPFSCKLRVTGINLLVLCSIAFLFLEVINLSFLPADYDDEMAIIGSTVWSILVLELFVEVMIRPNNYHQLVKSDKAFAPSTARYINSFHLLIEFFALATYIPEFQCARDQDACSRGTFLSRVMRSVDAILGPSRGEAAWGRFIMGLTSLRFFGVIRHWKQMWINNTFHPIKREGIEKWLFPREKEYSDMIRVRLIQDRLNRKKRNDDDTYDEDTTAVGSAPSKMSNFEEDQRLKNAATIGTALMVVNSQRALILMVLVVIVLPLLSAIHQQNLVADNLTGLLQSNNLVSLSGIADCEYLELAVDSWLNMALVPQPPSRLRNLDFTYVLWAQLLPVRCPFQNETGVITTCRGRLATYRQMPKNEATCNTWDTYSPTTAEEATSSYFSEVLGLRPGGIIRKVAIPTDQSSNIQALTGFNVTVIYNENPSISLANMGLFYLLLAILILGLYFLQALRGDAIRLVLDPLQRMLKIVLRYAENPLSQDVNKKSQQDESHYGSMVENEGGEIGNFETEHLINAITKIADLLRKCWGVAGAGIISSNLARTKDGKTVVFNPTVPGKRVYALFGFVAINGFSEILRALDRDIMILINDVAQVVHDEVYRWALGDHGQCNKNLGPAFLMVWRIGDFSEVHKKKKVATEVVFQAKPTKLSKRSTLKRRTKGVGRGQFYGRRGRNDHSSREIQLESLPGIQAFTDRALLGMLKSFAGIHRDKQLTIWKNDFRLSAGVGAYHADIMYGMDAGWAVEGAVGSEYKIDATYLSPHVNMASRMMSATKQYGVTILLSKAVEKLLSKNCRKKLRHLDTVYVKGSKVKQNIFTYDARFQGVDFFLLERTPEQADLESELYTPNIWDQDQDLLAMRQHVSDSFMETYHLGVKQYLRGDWTEAYKTFQTADSVMIAKVIEDGFLEVDLDEMENRIFDLDDTEEDVVRLRHELGDGACRTLMNFMKRRNLTPPSDWDEVRQLFSK